jgi:membrane protein
MDATALLKATGLSYAWIEAGFRQAAQVLARLVPFFISFVMFYQLYFFVPKPHPHKRSAFLGAAVGSLLWEVAKQAFTYYATYVGRFGRYSAADGFGSLDKLGNSFGLIIAFVFWIYFSGVVLMLGAVIAVLRENQMRGYADLDNEADDGDATGEAPDEDADDESEEDADDEDPASTAAHANRNGVVARAEGRPAREDESARRSERA